VAVWCPYTCCFSICSDSLLFKACRFRRCSASIVAVHLPIQQAYGKHGSGGCRGMPNFLRQGFAGPCHISNVGVAGWGLSKNSQKSGWTSDLASCRRFGGIRMGNWCRISIQIQWIGIQPIYVYFGAGWNQNNHLQGKHSCSKRCTKLMVLMR
jgi:hypothetical protein